MGWGNCGEDNAGRPIGYAAQATCDHPGCKEPIDRGLDYACGGMHGQYPIQGTVEVCDKYFCGEHKRCVAVPDGDGQSAAIMVCFDCRDNLNEIKAEAYRDLLADLVVPASIEADFAQVAQPPEAPTATDHARKRIYDVLIEWDEFDGVPLDGRYMTAFEFDRRSAVRDAMARRREAAVMGETP